MTEVRWNAARPSLVTAMLIAMLMVPFQSASRAQAVWFATWNVNLAKSTYPAGPPAFKRMTCKIEPWDEHVRVTYEIIGTRGGVTHIEWVGDFDGRDYPVAGIDGYVITHAYHRIDDRTYDVVQKTEGGGALTARMTISADGQTLTTITPGTPGTPGADARDATRATTTVYDRQ